MQFIAPHPVWPARALTISIRSKFMLKNKRVIVLSIALLVLVMSFGTANAEAIKFTLQNGTRTTISEFYASPPSVDDWEDDILGVDVLSPGESIEITIDDGREDCEYDFRIVFENGTAVEHDAVKVCNGETWVIQ